MYHTGPPIPIMTARVVGTYFHNRTKHVAVWTAVDVYCPRNILNVPHRAPYSDHEISRGGDLQDFHNRKKNCCDYEKTAKQQTDDACYSRQIIIAERLANVPFVCLELFCPG